MEEENITNVVKTANELIDALRIETDFDSENSYWEFEEEHIKWSDKEVLENLSKLADEFSKKCKDMAAKL